MKNMKKEVEDIKRSKSNCTYVNIASQLKYISLSILDETKGNSREQSQRTRWALPRNEKKISEIEDIAMETLQQSSDQIYI